MLFGDRELPPFEHGKESVGGWLAAYRQACETIELEDPRREWIKSVRRAISMTGRALVALDYLGGEISANELAEEITRRFESVMRVNNTRREVIRNPKLLEFVGEGKKIVRLLDYGREYLAAYLEAGGETGLDPHP